MVSSLFRIGVINQVADTFILYLVREILYPGESMVRVLAGGFLSALTYVIWLILKPLLPGLVCSSLAVIAVTLLTAVVFRVRTWQLLLRTLTGTGLCILLLGGSSLLTRQFLPTTIAFRHFVSLTLPASLLCRLLPACLLKKKGWGADSSNLYSVEIIRGKRRVRCTGLYDSANLLTSQVTGEGICVISGEKGERLLEEGKDKEIFEVKYHTVGKEEGRMPCILADHIVVRRGGKILVDKRGMVAVCHEPLSCGGRFCVLLPEDIFSARVPL